MNMIKPANNLLIHSDNLKAMQYLLNIGYEGKIDLVYIDPPFATNQVFIVDEARSATISMPKKGVVAYSDKFTLQSYLNFIKPRIQLIYLLLSERGSFYFHIDNKIGHYVKVLLDEIFGINNFKADISRIKCNPKNFSRRNYGNTKDMILFYTKTNNYIWNDIEESVTDCDINQRFSKMDNSGRRYTTVPLHAPGETLNGETSKLFRGVKPPQGRHWRYRPERLQQMYDDGLIEISSTGNMRLKKYADESLEKKVQDIWEFKDPQKPSYPTEKNSNMLDYIIMNSSNKESIIMDCFCGSGTTLLSAHRLFRKFIGIDESQEAIKQTKKKLDENKDIFSGFSFVTQKELNDVCVS